MPTILELFPCSKIAPLHQARSRRESAMSAPADRELHYFLLLSHAEQRVSIQRLEASGFSDYAIAGATRLSVEMIRAILGERPRVGE